MTPAPPMPSGPVHECDVAVVGGGPAGVGVVVAAADAIGTGPLSWCLVEAGPPDQLGRGRLDRYDVASDTPGRVFVETAALDLENLPAAERSHVAKLLARCETEKAIPLAWAADLFHLRARQGIHRLGMRDRVTVRSHARVTRLATTADGFELGLETPDGANRVRCRAVVLATGGRPRMPKGLVPPTSGRMLHSESALSMSQADLTRFAADSGTSEVVIVGGSHSAFSVADRLLRLDEAKTLADDAITLVHRSPIKVSYADRAAADADGFVYDESDVCPVTGRVFRFGGLRSASAELWRRWRDGRERRLRLVDLGVIGGGERRWDHAERLVAATGYEAAAGALVPQLFAPAPDGNRHPRIDAKGRYLDAHGHVIPGLYGIGLGSAVTRGPASGGEPSYAGPVDGLWYYQNVVAAEVVRSLDISLR